MASVMREPDKQARETGNLINAIARQSQEVNMQANPSMTMEAFRNRWQRPTWVVYVDGEKYTDVNGRNEFPTSEADSIALAFAHQGHAVNVFHS